MTERRVSVRVSIEGAGQASRELDKVTAEALGTSAALRSIPNHVDVKARSTGLSSVTVEAKSAERSTSALLDSVAMLWPTLAPISAAAVPAIAGLGLQFGVAAGAVGTMVLALHGTKDALKALDAYELAPTAANLAKVQDTMSSLPPATQRFVRELDHLEPQLRNLQTAAASGLLPGVRTGIDRMVHQLPLVRSIISEISSTSGGLAAEAGGALNDREWTAFLQMIHTEAQPVLTDLGHTLGDVTTGLADLMVATVPLGTSFSSGMASAAASFHRWADEVGKTQGFADFVAYVQKSGPEVLHTLGAIGNAFIQIVEAGSPLGGPILRILADVADLVARIADSPIGTPLVSLIAGISAVNRVLAVSASVKGSLVADLLSGRGFAASGLRSSATSVTSYAAALRGASVQVTEASAALVAAEERQAVAALAARDAQFALIPTSEKRAAVTAFASAQQDVAAATTNLSTAQKTASASLREQTGRYATGAVQVGLMAAQITGLTSKLHIQNATLGAQIGGLAGPVGAVAGGLAGGFLDLNKALESKFNPASITVTAAQAEKARTSLDAMNLAIDEQARGLDLTAAGARSAAMSVQDFTTQLDVMQGRLTKRADIRNFDQSLNDFAATVKRNGPGLNPHIPKQSETQAALDNIANTALQVASALTGLDHTRFLQRARIDFINAAIQAGKTREAATRLANKLIGLNQIHAQPSVTVQGLTEKEAQLRTLTQLMTELNGTHVDTYVTTHKTTLSSVLRGDYTPPKKVKKADGGQVFGPGGPRDDLIPARLSNREYVMPVAAVDHYGVGFMDAVRARRFANGGPVTREVARKDKQKHLTTQRLAAGAAVALAAPHKFADPVHELEELLT